MDSLFRTYIDLLNAEAAGLEKAVHDLEDEFEDQQDAKEEAMSGEGATALTDAVACLATARVKAVAALALVKNAREQYRVLEKGIRRAEREYKGYDDDGDGSDS